MKIDIKKIQIKYNSRKSKFYIEDLEKENLINKKLIDLVQELNKIKEIKIFYLKVLILIFLSLSIISLVLIYFSNYFLISGFVCIIISFISIFLYNKKFKKIDIEINHVVSKFRCLIEKNYVIKIRKSSEFCENSKKAAIILKPQLNITDKNCLFFIQSKNGSQLNANLIKKSLSKILNDNSYWLNFCGKNRRTSLKNINTITPRNVMVNKEDLKNSKKIRFFNIKENKKSEEVK